ncbi:TetR/AcrR family transcriptional regulator [Luteibacter anthropi]|uniref:TetR/AcrR family transcriptional regulator n=1 Tax=Luteibacter anthropi TaxID=564369 RepID=A0A7X5UAF4_9GAMM|nr:TetR/AcrR family transcriptional regulator [Luteibacter anthropi]NII06885.1 TetR/AcrR family transcriptional regulator [Luteibacter anthropi]URX61445.1 TetR/AcrR family transcriptional regulator [Luteibacter anthropi]
MDKPSRHTPSRPRKKPVQARSLATVTAILDAAAHILESAGPSAYSTNAVAALAGVSIGSVYQYFPTKDAITRALIDRETGVLLEDVSRAVENAHGAEALMALIGVAVHHQLRRPALGRILDYEEARLPMQEDMAQAAEGARVLILRCLQELKERVEKPAEAAADVMSIIKGMVDGAGQRGEVDETGLRCRVEAAVTGYLGQISAKGSSRPASSRGS